MVETIAFFAVLAVLVVLWHSAPRRYYWLAGFMLPLAYPGITVGINISWYKIIGPLTLVLLFLRKKPSLLNVHPLVFRLLIIYTVTSGALWFVAELLLYRRYEAAAAIGLPVGQTILKIPVQTGTFLALFALAVAYPVDMYGAGVWGARGFLYGVMCSIGFGVIQLAVGWQPTTWYSWIGDALIPRLGGLSGEPKALGALIVVCIFLIWFSPTGAFARANPSGFFFLNAILLAGLVGTLSTSAWVGLLAGIGSAALIYPVSRRRGQGRGRNGLLVATCVAAVVIGIAASFPGVVNNVVNARFLERLSGSNSEIDRQKDAYVLEAYRDSPQILPIGFGPGGTDLQVMRYRSAAESAYIRTPTAGTNGARLLGDFGFAGVALFAGTLGTWVVQLFRGRRPRAATFILAAGGAMLFQPQVALAAFMFLAGGVLLHYLGTPRPKMGTSTAGRVRLVAKADKSLQAPISKGSEDGG